MKKIVLSAAAIIVLLTGLLVAAPGFIDWTKYRPYILGRMHDATGYDYDIAGAFEMRLVPSPRLAVENLSVISPGHSAKPLLTLGRADVSVALLPLLTGKVVINSIELEKPQIRLEVAANGAQSWMNPVLSAKMNGVPAAPGANKNNIAGISLNTVTIKDGSFVYADLGSGKTYTAGNIDLTLHGSALSGPYTVDGTVMYGGQTAKLALKSGQVAGGADSLALQATVELPASMSKIVYSGAVGLRGDHEIQGETEIETASLKKLAAFAGDADLPPALDKGFTAKGMLTMSANELSYKDTKFTFAGTQYSGHAGITNLKAAGGKPMAVDVLLTAEKPVDLNKLLGMAAPAKNAKAAKIAEDAADVPAPAAPSFLPSSLTLPASLTATVALAAPSVHYRDTDLTDVGVTGSWKDQKAGGTIKAGLPGGSFDATFAIVPGSVSQSAAAKTITLSDPVLTYTANLKTSDVQKAIAPLLPPGKAQGLGMLQRSLALTASGDVKPSVIDITQGSLTVLNTTLGVTATYAPKKTNGRDFLRLALTGDKVDLDQWMSSLAPSSGDDAAAATAPAPAAAVSPLGDVIKQAAQKLVLPFDLDLSVAATFVKFKGTDYDKLNLLARLADKKLDIKTLQAQDMKGNDILLACTVSDLTTLKDMDLSVQGKTADLKKMITGFAPKMSTLPDSLKDGEIIAEFKGQADAMDFTANIKAMGGTLDATGTANNVLSKPVFSNLTVRMKHPDYVDVVRLFQPDFHGSVAIAKNLDLFASMKREKDTYTFSDLQGTVGPATFSGDVSADVSGAVPDIKAKLQLGDVALDQLTGHDSVMQGAVQAQREGQLRALPGGHWSREPLNADFMRKFNLDLVASAKSLSYNAWQIGNAAAELTLKDGTLDVKNISGAMYGGKTSLQGKVTAPDKPHQPLSVAGTVTLDGVDLQAFVTAFSGANLVKAQGNISVNADVTTAGASPADLVSGLNGSGKTSGKNIVFNGFDLARLSRTLTQPSSSLKDNLSSLVGSTMASGSTSFDALDGAFTIKQGIIDIKPLTLTGQAANVSSPGTVNLPLWTIDMESTITLNDAKDAPPLKVAIKGPLDQPAKAFGKSALDSYFGGRVKDILTKVLEKNAAETGGPQPPSTTVQATSLVPPESAAPVAPAAAAPAGTAQPAALSAPAPAATPATAAPAPAATPPPAAVKPKDAFKNLLQGVMQGQ